MRALSQFGWRGLLPLNERVEFADDCGQDEENKVNPGDNSMAEVGIFVGTMYGNSLLVAEEAEAILSGLGHKATVYEDPEVNDWESYTGKYVWWSPPPPGRAICRTASCRCSRALKICISHLRYGIIALGDSTYANFCGGGSSMQLLQEQGAKRIGEMLKIDASEDPEPESVSNPWVEQWATLLE
jgi:flavodoxin